VTPAWGVSAAASRPGAYGRGGPWEAEAADLETAYGAEHVLHVSLEEFARTLSTTHENRERLREGGVPSRAMADRLRAARSAGEVEQFRAAFRRFRAFDRPNVLHVFATFRRDPGFAREFPEAVQTGPLWPDRFRTARPAASPGEPPAWVWYASPASAERLAPAVLAGLARTSPTPHLWIFSARPWTFRPPVDRASRVTDPVDPTAWATRFAKAQVRIVTGSRTLLEAMELGGPFLYFNGILGPRGHPRRHRPEKITALLELAAQRGMAPSLRADLADFSRGRRVREIVHRAASGAGAWSRFPVRWGASAFTPPFDSAGELVVAVARALGRSTAPAPELVARLRAGRAP
jgi:hypothetical protein